MLPAKSGRHVQRPAVPRSFAGLASTAQMTLSPSAKVGKWGRNLSEETKKVPIQSGILIVNLDHSTSSLDMESLKTQVSLAAGVWPVSASSPASWSLISNPTPVPRSWPAVTVTIVKRGLVWPVTATVLTVLTS